MGKFMIVFDEADKNLIEETLDDQVRRLREDDDAVSNRLADRLEALRLVPVPENGPGA